MSKCFCLLTVFFISCLSPGFAEVRNAIEYQGNAKSIELNEKGTAAAQAKNFKQAEEYFRQALIADQYNLTVVFNLSSLYIRNKKEQKAIALLLHHVKDITDDAGLFLRLGDAYFASKQIKEAATYYKKAFNIDPGTPKVAEKLATLYTLTKNLDEAEKMLLHAIKIEPKDGQLLANLSGVFLANGKTEKAISTAKRALQLHVTSELYVTLGTAYEIRKDYKSSLIAFQRAVDLGDKRKELKNKIIDLKKVTL